LFVRQGQSEQGLNSGRVEREVSEFPDYKVQLALAAARLRAGRAEAAVTVLEAAVKAVPGTPDGWLLLALAHQRLGHMGEAGSALEKTKDNPLPGRWNEQLELELLRREAEAAVRGKERR
jgi:predicted Zn-dependent protease